MDKLTTEEFWSLYHKKNSLVFFIWLLVAMLIGGILGLALRNKSEDFENPITRITFVGLGSGIAVSLVYLFYIKSKMNGIYEL